MMTLKEKEAVLLHHRQEVERLQKEINEEKIKRFEPMLYNAYYCDRSKTYFFVDSISKSRLYPFGLSVSYSEIIPEFMVKPEEFVEVLPEDFFKALDEFIVRKKAEILRVLNQR